MTIYNEEDFINISALSHVVHCERRVALVYIEQLWEENRFTAEGELLHERVDKEHHDSRGIYKVEYGMAIRSLQYGLIGKADVVEFEIEPSGGYVVIRPVEFKRGKNKEEDCDRVQLCAQALCLEEMFGTVVNNGQFYYLQEHRRTSLMFDDALRQRTIQLVLRIREIFNSKQTPLAIYDQKKCDRCSLVDLCMPKAFDKGGKDVSRYMHNQIQKSLREDDP